MFGELNIVSGIDGLNVIPSEFNGEFFVGFQWLTSFRPACQ